MFFHIDTTTQPAAIALEEPDVFTAFSIVVAGEPDAAQERSALEQLGPVTDDDHVFVEEQRILSLAGERADDEAWRKQLEGMLGYARSKGWVDDAGRIRAHVEHQA